MASHGVRYNKYMDDGLKDLLTRAFWTFTQAFVASFLIGLGTTISPDWKEALIALLIASLAAGFSAVKTYIINKNKNEESL